MTSAPLYFLKLGGSLITDKYSANTIRPGIMRQAANEIAAARQMNPGIQILVGHGSGSFGHTAAQKFNTRAGVDGAQGWYGFTQVWRSARALNQILIDVMSEAGLPVISFPPSAAAITVSHKIKSWDTSPMLAALQAGLIPVIQGDTVFDQVLGGTILSTEDCFYHLAPIFKPTAILLAGIEDGVWADYPKNTRLIPRITPTNLNTIRPALTSSDAVDVTGGMLTKVERMIEVVSANPQMTISIFSGSAPGSIQNALLGKLSGTILSNENC